MATKSLPCPHDRMDGGLVPPKILPKLCFFVLANLKALTFPGMLDSQILVQM